MYEVMIASQNMNNSHITTYENHVALSNKPEKALGITSPQSVDILESKVQRKNQNQHVPKISSTTGTIPATATYRVQWNEHFGFDQLAKEIPYLKQLGISTVYVPPIFEAGSFHGYNIIDPNQISHNLGGQAGFDNLIQILRTHGMTMILDFPPNHMQASTQNMLWRDVLEHGQSSSYNAVFDIIWNQNHDNRVVLPILGGSLSELLENKEFLATKPWRITPQGFEFHYYEHNLPIDLRSMAHVLAQQNQLPTPFKQQLNSIIATLQQLPKATIPYSDQELQKLATCKSDLWSLYEQQPTFRNQIDALLQTLNSPADEHNLATIILNKQNYALSFWRTAPVNYRRFFDINELVGVKVEIPHVRELTHTKLFQLIDDNPDVITGLRIDHIDGLRDPKAYTQWLHKKNVFTICEKILAEDEHLQDDWSVDGTTGYEFLNHSTALFLNPRGLQQLTKIYSKYAAKAPVGDMDQMLFTMKRLVLRRLFKHETKRLTNQALQLANQYHITDLNPATLHQAITGIIAGLPHYRTYMDEAGTFTEDDQQVLHEAIETTQAWIHNDSSEFKFLQSLMFSPASDKKLEQSRVDFIQDLQQYSGASMAKALEDTSMYRRFENLALNEVGGEMELHGDAIVNYHQHNLHKATHFKHSLLTTSTHDTKRSEDVRNRIAAITNFDQDWSHLLAHLGQEYKRTFPNKDQRISNNDQVLLFQTLLGVWPHSNDFDTTSFTKRIQDYMQKAIREAKQHTSWTEINQRYETAMAQAVEHFTHILCGKPNKLQKQFKNLQNMLSKAGAINSLTQVILKSTAPGIPDFYRGCESWDLSLVDPDNRRPLDWANLTTALHELPDNIDPSTMMKQPDASYTKLQITANALAFRKKHAHACNDGSYVPLTCKGNNAILSYARQTADDMIITVAFPQAAATIAKTKAWDAKHLQQQTIILPKQAPKTWKNSLTGEVIKAKNIAGSWQLALPDILHDLPVAMLEPVTEKAYQNTVSISKKYCYNATMKEIQSVAPIATLEHPHQVSLGSTYLGENRSSFLVWSPKSQTNTQVVLADGRTLEMKSLGDGYYGTIADNCPPGTTYKIMLNGSAMPDPCSQFQPQGVHGPSQVVNHQEFAWQPFAGLKDDNLISLQAHVGTITPQGTYESLKNEIPRLAKQGFTAIQLMPLHQFPGKRNWGYDPAQLFAPHNTYGDPNQLKDLINTCHEHGIGVIIDVVYNHAGPDGAYLCAHGPYFEGKENTWGSGPSTKPEVIRLFAENLIHWAENYNIDGFRFDATHAIDPKILQELQNTVDTYSTLSGKKLITIAEDNQNNRQVVTPVKDNGFGFDAQCCDEFCHSLRMHLADHYKPVDKLAGYLVDFKNKPLDKMLTALARGGWYYEGQYSQFEKKKRGTIAGDLQGKQSVIFKNTHDQTGNTPSGLRPDHQVPFAFKKLEHTLLLLSPYNVQFFQGDDYGSKKPFYYFVNHTDPKLNQLVKDGRNKEFAYFLKPGQEMPDPTIEKTYDQSILDAKERFTPEAQALQKLFSQLVALRKQSPALSNLDKTKQQVVLLDTSGAFYTLRWDEKTNQRVLSFFNASDKDLNLNPFKIAKLYQRLDKQQDSLKDISGSWKIVCDTNSIDLLGQESSSQNTLTLNSQKAQKISIKSGQALVFMDNSE